MNVQYIDVEGIMKIELTINKSKDLPRGAIPALEKELLKRLQNQYENCSLVIRRAGGDSLTVFGGDKGDKTKVEEILRGNMGKRRRLVFQLINPLRRH